MCQFISNILITILKNLLRGQGALCECLSSRFTKNQYPGSLGDVQFDENRVAFYPIEFKIIRNGSFEHYEGKIAVQ
mgnify:CR=1 FL=1|jgi:hypothetical protein